MSQAANQDFELLRKKLRDEMNQLADHMASGGCVNFEEYKECVGRVTGLAYAERELLDLDESLYST